MIEERKCLWLVLREVDWQIAERWREGSWRGLLVARATLLLEPPGQRDKHNAHNKGRLFGNLFGNARGPSQNQSVLGPQQLGKELVGLVRLPLLECTRQQLQVHEHIVGLPN